MKINLNLCCSIYQKMLNDNFVPMKIFLQFEASNELNPKGHGGGAYMPPLWFFGSGFKRIWSTDLKFCDFSYMVISWAPTKFQADLMMF